MLFFAPGAARDLVASYVARLVPGATWSFPTVLKLMPPGVVDGREWYPDSEQPVHALPRDGQVIVGVARV